MVRLVLVEHADFMVEVDVGAWQASHRIDRAWCNRIPLLSAWACVRLRDRNGW